MSSTSQESGLGTSASVGTPTRPLDWTQFSPVLFLVILSHQNNHQSFSQHPTQKDHM